MPSDVDRLIAELLSSAVTVNELRQDAAHAAGLSSTDAERVRAHLLASFETRGIPAEAVPIVAEELRTSGSPAVLAGAARAVRSLGPDAGDPWRALLVDAADRIATADVFVRWQPGVVAPGWMRTARGEVLATLAELSSAAGSDGAAAGAASGSSAITLDRDALAGIALEDQDAAGLTLADALADRETVLAFFYTRCMNPARCSLTITRLAAAAREGGRAHLAITYDPAYDSPARLRRYGEERGFPFGDHARLARTPDAWPAVKAMFGLRVGYGPVTVNEHARELFVVGPDLVARGLDPDALAPAPAGRAVG